MNEPRPLYHLTLLSELRPGVSFEGYTPARLAVDGFIHCAADPETALAVAKSYFSAASEPVVVLQIERPLLRSPFRFESPAPLPGGEAHRTPGKQFPHIYGPLNLDAVSGAGVLVKEGDAFKWPKTFGPLEAMLNK